MVSSPTRRHVLRTTAAGAVGLTVLGTGSAGSTDTYVVTFGNPVVARRLDGTDFTVEHTLANGTVAIVTGPSSEQGTLRSVPGVTAAARNVKLMLDRPAVAEPRDVDAQQEFNPLQWDKQVTEAGAAHDVATGAGSRLAIADTGIDTTHPDLQANVDEDACVFFRGGTIVDVGEGGALQDPDGHGTHVAGTAAADGFVRGTAPDADLVSLRVFWVEDEDLVTSIADVLLAIDVAGQLGADAVNLSLGTAPIPPEFRQDGLHVAFTRVVGSATNHGTVVVASAGNDDTDLQRGGLFSLPNSTPGAMSISATGPNDRRSFYSNYGTGEIDVGAPGGGYETLERTLAPGPEDVPFPANLVFSTFTGGSYAFLAGTSMAAPQVTGAVGVLRELAPDANPHQIEAAIQQGADGANGVSDPDLGAGRLNVSDAIDRLSR